MLSGLFQSCFRVNDCTLLCISYGTSETTYIKLCEWLLLFVNFTLYSMFCDTLIFAQRSIFIWFFINTRFEFISFEDKTENILTNCLKIQTFRCCDYKQVQDL